jgi:hypothetical protein
LKVSSTNTENRKEPVKPFRLPGQGVGKLFSIIFQKKGKYYQILIDMTTSDPSQFFNNETTS